MADFEGKNVSAFGDDGVACIALRRCNGICNPFGLVGNGACIIDRGDCVRIVCGIGIAYQFKIPQPALDKRNGGGMNRKAKKAAAALAKRRNQL